MKMQPRIIRRIVKNALISLLIYALPVLVMFLVFYIRGERPWKKDQTVQVSATHHQR
jgi:preprotein translocase subunit YajC